MPAVIAGVLLILRGKYLGGAALTTIFFSLQVSVLHLQIIYYTGLIIGIIAWCSCLPLERKKIQTCASFISPDLFALVIGLLNYAYTLLPTRELVTETMRGGKSQLTPTDAKNKTVGGLNKDYAFSVELRHFGNPHLVCTRYAGRWISRKRNFRRFKICGQTLRSWVFRKKMHWLWLIMATGEINRYSRSRLSRSSNLFSFYSGNGICKKLA